MVELLALALWVASGMAGSYLMRYPDEGLNVTYVFSAICGPFALIVAVFDRLKA